MPCWLRRIPDRMSATWLVLGAILIGTTWSPRSIASDTTAGLLHSLVKLQPGRYSAPNTKLALLVRDNTAAHLTEKDDDG